MNNVKIKVHITEPVKVGDTVEFTINNKRVRDTVVYINGSIIEGVNYDLTYVKFTIVNN